MALKPRPNRLPVPRTILIQHVITEERGLVVLGAGARSCPAGGPFVLEAAEAALDGAVGVVHADVGGVLVGGRVDPEGDFVRRAFRVGAGGGAADFFAAGVVDGPSGIGVLGQQ